MPEDVFKKNYIEKTPIEQRKPLHQTDIPPKLIKQTHIEDIVIKKGNIADRPSNGSTPIRGFWAEDESKLYLWNSVNSAWESITLA